MPDFRYILKNNDPTSTGGILTAIRDNFTHHGVPIGLEGDIATCPACNSSGPVFNDCHPSWDKDGKQVLVSGARVHCKCPEHPTIFNTQTNSTVEVNRNGGVRQNRWASNPADPARFAAQSLRFDEKIHFLSSEGMPLMGVHYKILMEDGSYHSGVTDGSGFTERITSTKRLRILSVDLGLDGVQLGDDNE